MKIFLLGYVTNLNTYALAYLNNRRLSEIPSIPKKRIETIKEIWAAQKIIKEVMIFLQSHNVSTTCCVKIYKEYGAASIGSSAILLSLTYCLTQAAEDGHCYLPSMN